MITENGQTSEKTYRTENMFVLEKNHSKYSDTHMFTFQKQNYKLGENIPHRRCLGMELDRHESSADSSVNYDFFASHFKPLNRVKWFAYQ